MIMLNDRNGTDDFQRIIDKMWIDLTAQELKLQLVLSQLGFIQTAVCGQQRLGQLSLLCKEPVERFGQNLNILIAFNRQIVRGMLLESFGDFFDRPGNALPGQVEYI